MKFYTLLLLFTSFIGKELFSQNIEFIENKGQWDKKVLFMGKVAGGAFFIHKDGYTVLQHNQDDLDRLHQIIHDRITINNAKTGGQGLILHSHAYTVNFIGSNPKAEIVPDKSLYTYNNYFIGDSSQWASNCKIYQAVTIKNVYPDIDIRYYSDNGKMKYDWIVNPGANAANIALQYDGVDNLKIKKGELNIPTSVGVLKELSPYSYQYNLKGREEVKTRYSIKKNILRFNTHEFDPDKPLVIDPTLLFCSLTGSTADNWGFTATYGPDGTMFGGGIVFSMGFPTSPGAFQTNFGGGETTCFSKTPFDIGIMKLSADGTARLYATYIGGSGNEMPQSLIADAQGNLIIAGRTNSPSIGIGSYPVTQPVFGPGGLWDITITKLNVTGTGIIGSVRIGGTSDDGDNITPCGGNGPSSLQQNYGDEARSEVNLDNAGNIYLASCTQSTDFYIKGGFQSTLGGKQDGVILKFSPTLSTPIFSTYLGGSENDATYVLSVNPSNGNIYVAGGTESSNLPGPTAGTIGPSNKGGIDGFVSVISNNGATPIKTTYLGTSGIDQVYGLKFDKSGFPYVMGQTTGAWPVINANWRQPKGKQFIAKLQPDLTGYIYSTTFGKGGLLPDLSPVAFLVDRCENVYVSGWGGILGEYVNAGVQGLSVTPDAIKSTPDINVDNRLGQDFYFFVLEKNANSQLYGSFFGQNSPKTIGDHVDGGTSRFDQNGVIYQAICANCSNNLRYPTTPGAWAPKKPISALCNLAMVKIGFEFSGVRSGIQSLIGGVPRDTAGCVPLAVDFRDTLMHAVSYEWNFGDGSPQVTTTAPTNKHVFTNIGLYKVMLVAIDSTTCNIRDTSYVNIKVGDIKANVDFDYKKLQPCTAFRYQLTNTSVAPAGHPFDNEIFTWDFGDNTPLVKASATDVFHDFVAPGNYNVKLTLDDTVYCNSPDAIIKQIRVADLVKAHFVTPLTGCAPYQAQFTNTSIGGSQFIWDLGDGSTSTDFSPTHLYTSAGKYRISLIAIDSNTCNIIDTTAIDITVSNKPLADFSAAPQPPVENTPISFTNLSSADAIRFKWIFGDGDTLSTITRSVITHEYNTTGVFNACLVAFNRAGCPDTVCKEVSTLIVPALDVPNAFTPLSRDVNSKIYVRGFGIGKMQFVIWSRWGEKVFETNDKRIGWDGRYNGKILPMDVYAYTLEVEFTDGSKASKKGDITLIK